MLAQLVNEQRGLGIDIDAAKISTLGQQFPTSDPLRSRIESLYVRVRGNALPTDLYSDDALMFRIWNYRHQVTHRRRQPFLFNLELGTAVDHGRGVRGRWREFRARHQQVPEPGRSAHLILDPRDPPGTRAPSVHTVESELDRMIELVSTRCEETLALV